MQTYFSCIELWYWIYGKDFLLLCFIPVFMNTRWRSKFRIFFPQTILPQSIIHRRDGLFMFFVVCGEGWELLPSGQLRSSEPSAQWGRPSHRCRSGTHSRPLSHCRPPPAFNPNQNLFRTTVHARFHTGRYKSWRQTDRHTETADDRLKER